MKKFVYIVFVLFFIVTPNVLNAQTASFGGSLTTNNSEGSIRIGGDTLIITLTAETWVDTLGEDNIVTTEFINSMVGDGSGDWATVTTLLDYTNVVRSSDTELKIGFPAVPDYDIYDDEDISVTLPGSALTAGNPIVAGSFLTITHDLITSSLGGTITTGRTELNIRENPYQITISISNDTLVAEGAAFNAVRSSILGGISGNVNWSVINSNLTVSNVVRTNANTVTISIPAVSNYYIGSNETVSVSLPVSALQNGAYSLGSETFSITNLASSASFGGSLVTNNTETEMRKPGATLSITLNGDEWVPEVGLDDPVTTNLLASISGSAGGDWGSVATYLDYNDVNVTGSVLTITLPPEVGDYNIYSNETISATLDASTLASNSTIVVGPAITIQHDPLTAVLEGSVLLSKNESSISAGGDSIVLKLRNDIWEPTIGQSNAITTELLSVISGDQNWNLIPFSSDDVFRRNDSTLTIIIPEAVNYFIGSNETVSISIPISASANTNYSVIPSPPSFQVINEGVSFTLSGDLVTGPAETEADIRTGGKSLTITVNGDQWVNQIDILIGTANLLFNQISGSTSWNSNVTAYTLGNINLDSPSVLSLYFPAAGSYNIDVTDNIDISIVGDILKSTTGGPFLINNAFSVEPLPASITTSGNIQSGMYNKEDSIRAGGGEIIFTLSEDEWATGLGDENVLTANLINSISGSAEWETKVKPAILGIDQGASYVNVVGQVLTISLPDVINYNILTTDVLTCEIPASCLEFKSSGTVTATPVISILPAPAEAFINDPGLDELTLNGAMLTLSLKDETFKDLALIPSNFSTSKTPDITVTSVSNITSSSVDLSLAFSSDFDSDFNDFSITVNAAELTSGASLTSNNISVTAQREPEIDLLIIDNSSYIIDDVVMAEVRLIDNGNFTLLDYSGTIAGRTLDSLKYINNTLCYAYFKVNEGGGDFSASDNIPVVDLQINSTTLAGEIYQGAIISSTVIDASRPVVNYIQVSGNSKKIGDEIEMIVSADDNSYTAIAPTSVNFVSIPDVSLQDLGNGVYILKYKIREGDMDVIAGGLDVKLTLRDQAGNISSTYTVLPANSISIDANRPVISKIQVANGVYTLGDTIEIVVTTDADAGVYNFDVSTEVNGVPYYSTALWGLNTGAGQYTLYYKVKSSDSEVDPGTLDVQVKMTDLAGNSSSVFQTVDPNSLAIYTVLPTATVAGNFEICEDDSALIVVNLSGRFPMKIYSSNGALTTLHDGILASPYKFQVYPDNTVTYRIDSVIDFNGIKNSSTGEVEILVNSKTDVEFINLDQSFSLEDPPVELKANFSGGIFTGPGVISTGGYFNPQIADTTNSPHTLYYTYTNDDGCTSMDSAVVFVLGAQGDIYIPKPVYCDYDGNFDVIASNTAGSTGSFRLLNSSLLPVVGLADKLNNSATISPTLLEAGVYTVEYKYVDAGATLVLREDFTIESVQSPKMDALRADEFCQNEGSIPLTGNPETAVFSGLPGVVGNINDGFNFNPQLANLGQNTIVFTNTSEHGCVSSVSKDLTVNFVPDIQFVESDVCIASDDIIYFLNQTADKHTVSEWNWNYGDINSGENNFSTGVEGSHKYTKPGNRTIVLNGTTPQGCVDSYSRTVDFGDKPDGTFVWTNECFLEGDSILFISNVESENELTSFDWVFYNSPVDSTVFAGADQIYYTFSGIDDYNIKLTVETEIGCKNEFNRTIVLKPTIRVSDEGFYFEDFETDNGRWSANTSQTLPYNSWDYNLAEFSSNSTNNSRAWFTDVPNDTIVSEQSWVISPCFNLRDVEKPMISLDIFRDLEDNEGVVLQYSINNEISWQNVGTLNQGINWFNDFTIANKPAGQEIGWSGSQTQDEWIKAVRYIDEIKDKPNVRFKLHYGTSHQLGLDRKGFAFDNFKITSRTRMVLMENYTNGSNLGVVNSDNKVNSIYADNFSDVVKLEYHTDIGGPDVFNASNIFVPATRALFYGVSKLPELIIDGGGDGLLSYTSDAQIQALSSNDIVKQSLLEPLFEIGLNVSYGQEQLMATVDLKALYSLEEAERILQVVVYEKIIDDVVMPNGQMKFRNVVKDMIPNAAGKAYFNAWEEGESVSEQYSWNYQDVYDPEMLRIAVFIQNDNTKQVYQAATDDKSFFPTGIQGSLVDAIEMNLYPNPAREFVYLKLSAFYNEAFNLEIFDHMGRIIEQREWLPGSQLERIELDQYIQGVYLIRLRDNKGNIRGIKKLSVVK
ncbi:MAG: T9SS type A sorting domain-containing protein [Bacteroidales bacterium]|nr:T9SS type A sorting domain-containing protein [Bacteroidales bacterium]MCF8390236.1 T9SS type A sorting domain-containing protein [Bacteroidales bacterium]